MSFATPTSTSISSSTSISTLTSVNNFINAFCEFVPSYLWDALRCKFRIAKNAVPVQDVCSVLLQCYSLHVNSKDQFWDLLKDFASENKFIDLLSVPEVENQRTEDMKSYPSPNEETERAQLSPYVQKVREEKKKTKEATMNAINNLSPHSSSLGLKSSVKAKLNPETVKFLITFLEDTKKDVSHFWESLMFYCQAYKRTLIQKEKESAILLTKTVNLDAFKNDKLNQTLDMLQKIVTSRHFWSIVETFCEKNAFELQAPTKVLSTTQTGYIEADGTGPSVNTIGVISPLIFDYDPTLSAAPWLEFGLPSLPPAMTGLAIEFNRYAYYSKYMHIDLNPWGLTPGAVALQFEWVVIGDIAHLFIKGFTAPSTSTAVVEFVEPLPAPVLPSHDKRAAIYARNSNTTSGSSSIQTGRFSIHSATGLIDIKCNVNDPFLSGYTYTGWWDIDISYSLY